MSSGSMNFVCCRTDSGKSPRTLNNLNERHRECLTVKVKRKLKLPEPVIASSLHRNPKSFGTGG